MRSILTASVLTICLLQPLAALAGSLVTPDALSRAINSDPSPRTFLLEVHIHTGDTYIAIWANGSQEGSVTDLASGAGTIKATVDIADPAMGTQDRFKGEFMFLDNTGYLKLDSAALNQNNDAIGINITALMKKWVSIPDLFSLLSGEADATSIGAMIGSDLLAPSDVGDMLDLTSGTSAGVTTYLLTLKPSFVRSLGLDLSDVPAGKTLADAVNLRATVATDAHNRFLRSDISGGVTLNSFDATLAARIVRSASPLTVTAPMPTMTLDEFRSSLPDLGVLNPLQNLQPSSDDGNASAQWLQDGSDASTDTPALPFDVPLETDSGADLQNPEDASLSPPSNAWLRPSPGMIRSQALENEEKRAQAHGSVRSGLVPADR